ncbi:hypothetical protein D9M68_108520 [compost metagenome]
MAKPLSSLTHEDLLAYERFLADPQPAARWVLTGSKKLARSHPDWRPFAGPLSPGSVRQAMVILNACFTWLTEAGYLAGNPLALARRRRAPSRPRITRYLSHDWWATVKDTVVNCSRHRSRRNVVNSRDNVREIARNINKINDLSTAKESWVFRNLCDDGELAWRTMPSSPPPHHHHFFRLLTNLG